MKKNVCLSRFHRTIVYLFVILLVSFSVVAGKANPALAAGKGWVEITATAPDDLNSYVILSLVEDETAEEFAFPVLRDNNFYMAEEIPAGKYTVTGAWVYQDYRYPVTCNVDSFVLNANEVIPIELTVGTAGEEISISSEKTGVDSSGEAIEPVSNEIDEPDTNASIKDAEDDADKKSDKSVSDKSENNKGRPIWIDIIISIAGVLVFGGIFFAIYFIARRNH